MTKCTNKGNNRLILSDIDILKNTVVSEEQENNDNLTNKSLIQKEQYQLSEQDKKKKLIPINIILNNKELKKLDDFVYKFKSKGIRKINRSVIIRHLIQTMNEKKLGAVK